MHHSIGMMQLLLHHGVNPKQTTSSANNMVHILIANASTEPEENERTDMYTLQWIRENVTDEVYFGLLLTENVEGLRPLELAAHLGTYWLFQFIFETPRLYLAREVDHYLYKIQFFDITDYVNGSRMKKSPVRLSMYLEERKLPCQSTKEMFLQDPMRAWSKATICTNTSLIILWFVLRLLWIITLVTKTNGGFYSYTCPSESMNASSVCFQWISFETYAPGFLAPLNIMIFFVIVIHIVDDLAAFFRYCRQFRWMDRNLYKKKVLCLRYTFYVLIHSYCVFQFITEMLYTSLLDRLDRYRHGIIARTLTDFAFFFSPYRNVKITNGLISFGFVWSILFFVQLLPHVGHYVIATQRMLGVVVEFSVIFSLFFLSYSFTMYAEFSITYGFDFASIQMAMYNTFLMMQNLYDVKSVPSFSMNASVHLLHITFVLMVSVLLLNFLIALLISSYDYVHKHRELLLLVQRLSVAIAVEDRFPRLFEPFREYLSKKYLVYKNDRVYVTRKVRAPKQAPFDNTLCFRYATEW